MEDADIIPFHYDLVPEWREGSGCSICGFLGHKGETSHHVQNVHEIRLDCDEDVIILKVEQIGGIACHTGRESCFYRIFNNGEWQVVEPVLKDPSEIY